MKERFRSQLAAFFISVTLIDLAIFILGCLLEPELKFGYEAFAYPLIYGVIGSLPGLVMYSKKELTMKQAHLLVRLPLHTERSFRPSSISSSLRSAFSLFFAL